MDYRILPPDELIEGRLTMPPSKSIAARALIMRAFTTEGGTIDNLPDCDDTVAVVDALQTPTLSPTEPVRIDIGAAGTAMRFLTAFYAATEGTDVVLDGTERMRRRPIAPLVEALRLAGADIAYTGEEGFPPLHIRGTKLHGGEVHVDASISSQYISALLMAAPLMSEGLELHLEGEVASRPYIMLTLRMMDRRGIAYTFADNIISIAPQAYAPVATEIEGDWSAAAFWLEIAAVSCGFITLDGMELQSMQGDVMATRIFKHFGTETVPGEEGGLDLQASPDQDPRLVEDMADCPDLVQATAVTAALLGIPFRLSGVESLRIKETDRIEALRRELLKIGVSLQVEGDSVIEWDGRRHPIGELPVFDTYKDHRMAMAFAPVALFIPGIVIKEAEVVSKSYPNYWDDLRAAGFTVMEAVEAETPES